MRDRGVGFVFQHYALFPHMTLHENIAFGMKVSKVKRDRSAIDARVRELLNLVKLDGLGDRFPAQISGGQRQRVALARALSVDPKVLLLDEPFGALDANVRRDLRRWLREIHDALGITTIFVTHDQEEALDLADRVVILNQGEIVQQGTPKEVCRQPNSAFVMRFLGDANRVSVWRAAARSMWATMSCLSPMVRRMALSRFMPAPPIWNGRICMRAFRLPWPGFSTGRVSAA